MKKVLIYGANGYMGRLCAKEMLKQGIHPILAGRSEMIPAMGNVMDCETAVFSLDHENTIKRHLRNVTLVVNLAGPFELTQEPLVEACLSVGCHYIDITGEVDEMKSVFAYDSQAKQAGLMLMPGAGFGVVPTDIAAVMAKERLPEATHLTILFATEGGVSRGTLHTVLKNINQPGVRLVNQEWVTAYPAESHMDFTVAGKRFKGVYNPWRADLFTAGLSTEIDNIETFSVFPGLVVKMMKGKLLWLRNTILRRLIFYLPEGPTEKQLQEGSTYVKAIAKNGSTTQSVALKGPEAYLFTAICLIEISKKVLGGNFAPGFQTPAYFGKELLDGIEAIQWD